MSACVQCVTPLPSLVVRFRFFGFKVAQAIAQKLLATMLVFHNIHAWNEEIYRNTQHHQQISRRSWKKMTSKLLKESTIVRLIGRFMVSIIACLFYACRHYQPDPGGSGSLGQPRIGSPCLQIWRETGWRICRVLQPAGTGGRRGARSVPRLDAR